MLPNCFVIGAAKCGTTSLHEYLGRHPDIYMSAMKEPHYFSFEWGDDRGWYEALFAGAGDALVRGESSPEYSKTTEYPEVPGRIAATVPEARLLYLIRDPVERIRSQYEHYRTPPRARSNRWHERRSFSVAIREDSRYVDGSRYAFQIERYLEHFDRGQLLVLSAEELRRDRRAALRRTFAFLDVEPDFWDPGYELELHRTEDRPSASGERIVSGLRGSPLRRVLPGPARHWLKDRLRNPRAPRRVEVTEEDARWMWDQLAPDVARLRTFVGPEIDLWGRA